ncbi:HAD family hydrolase [Candidatus Bipolaricaulota sp. J31]
MIRAVLLDVGGPILDEEPEYRAWERFLSSLLREHGIEVTAEDVHGVVLDYTRRMDSNPWLAVLWYYLGPDVRRFRAAEERFREFKREWLARREFRVQRGVREAIATLRERGYILAIAANQEARTGEFLRREGITAGFAWDLVSEEMGVTKPLLIFFRMILDGIGVPPAEAVMVGDRLDHDVLPARILGMRAVRVLVGPYRDQIPVIPAHCPDHTIPDLRALPAALTALERAPR